jgi:hypothetical protein
MRFSSFENSVTLKSSDSPISATVPSSFRQVLQRAEAFQAVGQFQSGAFVVLAQHGAAVHGAGRKDRLERIPGVFFQLLVAQGQAAAVPGPVPVPLRPDFAYLHQFGGVLDLLGPRQVRYVHEAVTPFFQFDEQAEVGQVAHEALVRVPTAYLLSRSRHGSRVFAQLLDAQAHLAVVAVERQNLRFYRVALLDEVLRVAQVLAPAHFRHVDQAFYAGHSSMNAP